jgi:hypothetical protein
MAAFNKFNQFVADVGDGKHVLSSHVMKVLLTNTAPTAANSIKGDLTEIAAGNGYTAGGNTASTTSWSQSSGTGKLVLADPATWTAAGGSIGPFRYAVLYNDTQTVPAKPLVGYWDYGSPVTLAVGETFTVDLDQVNGVLTLA